MSSRSAVSLASDAAMKRLRFLSTTRSTPACRRNRSWTCCGAPLPGHLCPGRLCGTPSSNWPPIRTLEPANIKAVRRLLETHDYAGVIATLKASGSPWTWRGWFPDGVEVGDCPQRPGCAEVHSLQCRRERTRHHQRPLHHAAPSLPGHRRHDSGGAGDRRKQGIPLHSS